MALQDISTGGKQTIVVLILLLIIYLKIKGIFTLKPTIFMIIALGIVSSFTDAIPTNAQEFPPTK